RRARPDRERRRRGADVERCDVEHAGKARRGRRPSARARGLSRRLARGRGIQVGRDRDLGSRAQGDPGPHRRAHARARGVRRRQAARDDIVHFEIATTEAAEIPVSPMLARATPAIAWRHQTATTFETAVLRVELDGMCATVTDLAGGRLQRVCATSPQDLTITQEATRNLYGLGEQFLVPGTMDGDWMGRTRTPGNKDGNAMLQFDGGPRGSGSNGNAQFPILYALAPGRQAYAMFVDD